MFVCFLVCWFVFFVSLLVCHPNAYVTIQETNEYFRVFFCYDGCKSPSVGMFVSQVETCFCFECYSQSLRAWPLDRRLAYWGQLYTVTKGLLPGKQSNNVVILLVDMRQWPNEVRATAVYCQCDLCQTV